MISETAKTMEIPGISTLPGDRGRSEPAMVSFEFSYFSFFQRSAKIFHSLDTLLTFFQNLDEHCHKPRYFTATTAP